MAASWIASRSPTRVITQRLWSESISRSRRKTPGIFIASTMASTLALSRPSEKFGTHSTRVLGIREKDKGLRGLPQVFQADEAASSLAFLLCKAQQTTIYPMNINIGKLTKVDLR